MGPASSSLSCSTSTASSGMSHAGQVLESIHENDPINKDRSESGYVFANQRHDIITGNKMGLARRRRPSTMISDHADDHCDDTSDDIDDDSEQNRDHHLLKEHDYEISNNRRSSMFKRSSAHHDEREKPSSFPPVFSRRRGQQQRRLFTGNDAFVVCSFRRWANRCRLTWRLTNAIKAPSGLCRAGRTTASFPFVRISLEWCILMVGLVVITCSFCVMLLLAPASSDTNRRVMLIQPWKHNKVGRNQDSFAFQQVLQAKSNHGNDTTHSWLRWNRGHSSRASTNRHQQDHPTTVVLDSSDALVSWLRDLDAARYKRYHKSINNNNPNLTTFDWGRLNQDYVRTISFRHGDGLLNKHFGEHDYGDLILSTGSSLDGVNREYASARRTIRSDATLLWELERSAQIDAWDDESGYLEPYYEPIETVDPAQPCHRPQWAYAIHSVCNTVHELRLEGLPSKSRFNIQYLAHGFWRDAWLFQYQFHLAQQPPTANEFEGAPLDFVLKHLRIDNDSLDFNCHTIDAMHQEAMVMERLTTSPWTTDLYGYCATTLMVQTARELTFDIVPEPKSGRIEQPLRGRIGQDVLDQLESDAKGDAVPLNNYTAEEKLHLMTAMATSIAEMHGYCGGVIVNDDVHPDQWLITDSGRVLLNDMNNAVVLEWNRQEGVYCPYYTQFGGDYRAPEEYRGAYVDETADMWAVGNLIFSLLTGLWPYYEQVDENKIEETTMQGIPPYLSPRYAQRSLIERRMVELMQLCHRLEPSERVDIFFVLSHLRETAQLHQQEQEQQLTKMDSLPVAVEQ